MKKTLSSGLFKNLSRTLIRDAQVQGAQKTESRGVCGYTLSGEVCSATPACAGVNSADACPAYAGGIFQQPRSGFTLVEILIAIFILGLVMATVYASYSSVLKTTHEMEEELNLYKMARVSMDRMIKDLSSLQSYSGSFYLRAEKKSLDKYEFHSLSFWSASHLAFGENEEEGRPAAISYHVQEEDDRKSFSLWRADVADSKPDETKNAEGGFKICKNIDSFKLKFYDSSGTETDAWDSSSESGEQKGKMPAAIEIELFIVNPNDQEKSYKFMTKVFLPVQK
jgi:prepilin-type N-terminal cleavage/methylation domain-containing protein